MIESHFTGFDGFSARDGRREKKSDFENSDDEKAKLASIKKRAMIASTRLRHSFRKTSRQQGGRRVTSVSVEDVLDLEGIQEIQTVDAFRQALIFGELLPARHDDYHMMLR